MLSVTSKFKYPLCICTAGSNYLSQRLEIRVCPAPHSKFTALMFHLHRDAFRRFFKGQQYKDTRNNVSAYSAAWDRALAQRIPRVSLTRATITKITLPIWTQPPPLRRSRGSWISGVGMRGIRPYASTTEQHV